MNTLKTLLFMMVCSSTLAKAEDSSFKKNDTDLTISWVTESFTPFFIEEGAMKGKGISDEINKILMKEIADYQHQSYHLPILRITEGLKAGSQIVVNSYLKNPDDAEFAQYSIASLVVPPLQLTLRKEFWEEKLNSAKKISLKDFLKQGHILGVPERRHFGDILTPLLFDDENKYKKNVLHSQVSHYDSYAKMINLNRIDAAIGYEAEFKYYLINNGELNKNNLISIPIIENQKEYLKAYIVMPKNKWGDAFKVRVDNALRKVRNSPEYIKAMTDWFKPTPEYISEILTSFSSD